MEFVSTAFPERIAFGAQSTAKWNTTLVVMAGGQESTNQNWTHNREAFDVAPAIRNATAFAEVRAHFNTMRGRAKSFPFTNPIDYTVTQSNGVTAVAEDASFGYQLFKRYGTGNDAYDKKITRPKTGLQIYRTRGSTTTNVTGSATVELDGGTFDVTGHVSGDIYTWSGQFYLPCRYDTDELVATAINKEPGPDGELLIRCETIPIVEVKE